MFVFACSSIQTIKGLWMPEFACIFEYIRVRVMVFNANFQLYFSDIAAISFIGGGKPLKSINIDSPSVARGLRYFFTQES